MTRLVNFGRGISPEEQARETPLTHGAPRGLRRNSPKSISWANKRSRLHSIGRKRVEGGYVERRAEAVAAVKARDGGCTFLRHVEAHAHELSEADRRELAKAGECWGAITAHEPEMRSHGADSCDPEQAISICFGHHRFAHEHPRVSQLVGLITYPVSHVNVRAS